MRLLEYSKNSAFLIRFFFCDKVRDMVIFVHTQLRSSTWLSIIAKIHMSVSLKQVSRPLSMLMSHHRPSSVRLFCECVHFCTTQVLASQMLCYIQQACHKTPSGVPSWYTFLAPPCILQADPNPLQIYFFISPLFDRYALKNSRLHCPKKKMNELRLFKVIWVTLLDSLHCTFHTCDQFLQEIYPHRSWMGQNLLFILS